MSGSGKPREIVPNRHSARLRLKCHAGTRPEILKGSTRRAARSKSQQYSQEIRSLKDAGGYRYTVVVDVEKNSNGKKRQARDEGGTYSENNHCPFPLGVIVMMSARPVQLPESLARRPPVLQQMLRRPSKSRACTITSTSTRCSALLRGLGSKNLWWQSFRASRPRSFRDL